MSNTPNKTFPWKKILLMWLVWRLVLFLLAYLAPLVFSYQGSFVAPESLLNYGLPDWLARWASFDGVHYLTIAKEGYKTVDLIQAFFPLYPLLIQGVDLVINNALISALLVSNLASVVMLMVWYLVLSPHLGEKRTWLSMILLLLFPSSFFLGAAYNEGLFIIFVLLTFYFFEKKQWPLASLMIALASATRVVGIVLVPATVLALFWQNKGKIDWRASLWLLVGSSGLIVYMLYLAKNFGDPFYFLTVQERFGGGRQDQLVLLPRVMWRYVKILVTARPIDWRYLIYIEELGISLFTLWYLIKAWLKAKVPLEWSIFAIGAYLMPTVTGTFSSMPRYVLVCLPVWLYIANRWPNYAKWQKLLYLTISGLLLIINSMLFIQGRWVA